MSGTTIREFMVALGFDTDNAGAKQMGDTLVGTEFKAKALNAALISLAAGAITAVAKTAGELDKLYYSSQRIGASASNIRGYEAALSQMGGTAANALQTLESVSQKIRQSPGYEGMIKNLGVSTRDQNGAMRDRVDVMKDMSKTLAGMKYYQANAYAGALGIDENTLMAMRDPAFTQNLEKYQKLQKDMGMSDGLAKSGKDFMVEFRDITMTTKAISEVIIMTAGKSLIPVLKIINTGLQTGIGWFKGLNPQVKEFLTTGLKIAAVVIVIGGLVAAGGKLIGMIGILKSLVGLFKLLRIVMLASPIGIILALAAAIALLYDDYKIWKEGGKSLIDWGAWSYGIEGAIKGMKEIADWLKKLSQAAIDFGAGAFEKLANTDFGQAVVTATTKAAAATKEVTKAVVKDVVDQLEVKGGKNGIGGMKNGVMHLTDQDIEDIVKVTSTEVVGGLKGQAFEQQTKGVVDTILNRTASGKWGSSVRDVINSHRQFTKITGPKSYKTKDGKIIKNNPYGSVQNMPSSAVNQRVRAQVLQYLQDRANGTQSSVGNHLNYANPYASDKKNRKAWVDAFYKQAKEDGLVFGTGKAVHGHGTTKDLQKFRPKPFAVVIDGKDSSVDINSSGAPVRVPIINTTVPPSGNPHKEQTGGSTTNNGKNITIHQSHKTDIVINGADNPQLTANKIQQSEENSAVQMARNARTVIG